ncbi:MAG: hypothetical protein ABSG85_07105 [Spirochaetia bacterium]
MSIGDGTVIGGEVVIVPHIAGGTDVLFGPIRIGKDCRIGAHVAAIGGMAPRDVVGLEKGRRNRS